MESLKKKIISLLLIALAGFLSFELMHWIFSGPIAAKERVLETRRLELIHSKEILSQKKDYDVAWEKACVLIPKNQSAEEALNLWVKDLLAFASTEGITFTKLEPQGVRQSELRLSLLFQGDIRKLIHLFYYLLEKDPLSRIENFSLKQGEDKVFVYELTLGKRML